MLALERTHGVAPVVPDLVGLLLVLFGSTVVGAARNGLSDLQVEHATRHVRARILDVTGTGDLEEFERPAFYDLLKRAIEYGVPAPYVITMSLLGLAATARSRLVFGVDLRVRMALEPLAPAHGITGVSPPTDLVTGRAAAAPATRHESGHCLSPAVPGPAAADMRCVTCCHRGTLAQ